MTKNHLVLVKCLYWESRFNKCSLSTLARKKSLPPMNKKTQQSIASAHGVSSPAGLKGEGLKGSIFIIEGSLKFSSVSSPIELHQLHRSFSFSSKVGDHYFQLLNEINSGRIGEQKFKCNISLFQIGKYIFKGKHTQNIVNHRENHGNSFFTIGCMIVHLLHL